VLKLTLLLLSNKAMLIWSVRNHLIGLCCFWTSNHNLLFCYTLFELIGIKTSLLLCQWLPLENVESGQINLRCTWFTLTPKPEDLSPVSGHYLCHTIEVLSAAHVWELFWTIQAGGLSNFERMSVACQFLLVVVLSYCHSVSSILKMIKVAYGSGRLRNF